MARPGVELGAILREHGEAFTQSYAGRLGLEQLKVMSAIERCRTAALGGHVWSCEACSHAQIAYNACRNRHCPACQGKAARDWFAAREAELLPVPYFHVVFTLPAELGRMAYQNKALVYRALFQAAAEALLTLGADPKRFGAKLGMIGVLHTWGSAMTHHPHLHAIVPGGGLSLDSRRWIASKYRDFLLPVRVLSRLFRRLMLTRVREAYERGELRFFGELQFLADPMAFTRLCNELKRIEWVIDCRAPFDGPKAVLGYLARYTHRVAISNSRLIDFDDRHVTFRWKDYRASDENRYQTMRLDIHEFIRRFLLHVLPRGFHRIRHFGLFANGQRKANLETARALLDVPPPPDTTEGDDLDCADAKPPLTCPQCGHLMSIVEFLGPAPRPRGGDPP